MLHSQQKGDEKHEKKINQDHCMSEKNLSEDTLYPAKDLPSDEPFRNLSNAIDRMN